MSTRTYQILQRARKGAVKIVALEERFATAEVVRGWKSVDPRWSDLALKPSTEGEGVRRMLDLGVERRALFD